MDMESFIGLIILFIRESFFKMKLVEKGNIIGKMEGLMKEIGSIIRCMERESLDGLMEGCILESIEMIKKKGLEFLYGRMLKSIQGIERMGSSMEKELFWIFQIMLLKANG